MAVCVVVLPFGAVKRNVTAAPEARVPPFVTVAVMATELGAVKFVPASERLTVSEGAVITVAFAAPKPFAELFDAFKFTPYVPAGVPEGAPLVMTTEVDWPGLSVTDEEDSDVDHPGGSDDARLIMVAAHALESLFVTVTE